MTIQPSTAPAIQAALPRSASTAGSTATSSTPHAASATTVTLSAAARARQAEDAAADSSAVLDTSHGRQRVDLDTYFTTRVVSPTLSATPLLMPTADNVAALAHHVSQRMPGFLAEHDIPLAPETIRYGNDGTLQLPDDYPYADAFKAALEDDPALARELSTVNALASHVIGLARAASGQPGGADMALQFDEAARLRVMADGDALLFDEHRNG